MEYKPHDKIPASGVYSVLHDKNHIKPHDVTCIEGRRFPTCAGCKGEHPRFVLKLAAIHITEHKKLRKS